MNKEILRLAIPNILSNISIPLLSSVDTALMGQLSTAHIGAVGIGAMIFNLSIGILGFYEWEQRALRHKRMGSNRKSIWCLRWVGQRYWQYFWRLSLFCCNSHLLN